MYSTCVPAQMCMNLHLLCFFSLILCVFVCLWDCICVFFFVCVSILVFYCLGSHILCRINFVIYPLQCWFFLSAHLICFYFPRVYVPFCVHLYAVCCLRTLTEGIVWEGYSPALLGGVGRIMSWGRPAFSHAAPYTCSTSTFPHKHRALFLRSFELWCTWVFLRRV